MPGFCSSPPDRSSPLTRNRKAGPSRNRLIPNALIREIRVFVPENLFHLLLIQIDGLRTEVILTGTAGIRTALCASCGISLRAVFRLIQIQFFQQFIDIPEFGNDDSDCFIF